MQHLNPPKSPTQSMMCWIPRLSKNETAMTLKKKIFFEMLCSQSKFFLEETDRYLGLSKDRFLHSKQRVSGDVLFCLHTS